MNTSKKKQHQNTTFKIGGTQSFIPYFFSFDFEPKEKKKKFSISTSNIGATQSFYFISRYLALCYWRNTLFVTSFVYISRSTLNPIKSRFSTSTSKIGATQYFFYLISHYLASAYWRKTFSLTICNSFCALNHSKRQF